MLPFSEAVEVVLVRRKYLLSKTEARTNLASVLGLTSSTYFYELERWSYDSPLTTRAAIFVHIGNN